jgi:hypothetical protein
MEKKL